MSTTSSRWVLATANLGKLVEIESMLHGSGIELIIQSAFDIAPTAETARTFVENALIKARHAALMSGLPAIADDSGLTVDALHGAPGVRSARYAGLNADDRSNVARLLDALRDVPSEHRGARFHCVMVALRHADDPAPLVATGTWRGYIGASPVGRNGFGYDPVFFDPGIGCTAAQLPLEEKNRISHRGLALRDLARQLRHPCAD